MMLLVSIKSRCHRPGTHHASAPENHLYRFRIVSRAVCFLLVAALLPPPVLYAEPVGEPVPGEPGAVRKPYVPYKPRAEKRQISSQVVQPVNAGIGVIGTDAYPIVVLFVSVTDIDGRPIAGLTETNFGVSEQGEPIENIQADQPSSAEPLAVALVMDRSGSMDLSTNPDCNPPVIDQCPILNACPEVPIRLDRAQEAANAFVANLQGADRATLVTFSGTTRVDVELTSNKAELLAGIGAIQTVCEGTAIYDAAYFGVETLTGVSGIRAVVLVSDGGDNSSSRTNAEAIEFAQANRVPIYTIAYGGDFPDEDLSRLRELSEFTGGQFHEAPTNEDLSELYVRIGETIRGQYRVRYTAPNVLGTGETRTVSVTVNLDGFTALASATYRFARELTLDTPENFDVGDVTWLYNLEVPEGAENLFVLLQKTTTTGHGWQPRGYGSYGWEGTMTVLRESQALAADVGFGDFAIHIPNPDPGRYTVEITSDTPGAGILTARTSLPELPLGEWAVGTILRSWGSMWFQLEVPPGIESLFFKVEALGVWSPLDVYQGVLRRGPRRTSAGERSELTWQSPEPGTYYVEFTDSAIIWTANDEPAEEQQRDFLIRADSAPIAPPPSAGPVITSLSTYEGGNTGPVTVTISGSGFNSEADVTLSREGATAMHADGVHTTANGSLAGTFDLTNATPGNWVLEVTNPDGQSAQSDEPFVITEGGEPDLWVEIVGSQIIRAGRPSRYVIHCGNDGTTDAVGVPIWVGGIPLAYTWQLDFPIETPAFAADGLVDLNYSTIPKHIESDNEIGIPLVIGIVAPGEVVELQVIITPSDERHFELRAWLTDPMFGSPLTQAWKRCLGNYFTNFIRRLPPIADCAIANVEAEDMYWEFRAKGGLWSLIDLLVANLNVGVQCSGELASIFLLPVHIVETPLDIALAMYAFLRGEFQNFDCTEAVRRSIEKLLGIDSKMAVTPEDKYGLGGFDLARGNGAGSQRWVVQERALNYRIDFWNKEDASVAAQDVFVEDQLDDDLDWMSFSFGEVGFLRWKVELDGGQYFNVRVDLRPDMNLIVDAVGTFDAESGKASWTFRSLDPDTGEPPEDPLAGFLPPITDSGYEIGWVEFTVRPKADLPTGTQITNQALVNFDGVGPWNKAPKDPPEGLGPWLNTIDAGAPTSAVLPLDAMQFGSEFTVSWSGEDDAGGSGIRSYTIHIAEDDGPYTVWLADTTETFATFTGEVGRTYKFFSQARDNVGNEELAPSARTPAQADTTVLLAEPTPGRGAPTCGACGSGSPAAIFMLMAVLPFLRGVRRRT